MKKFTLIIGIMLVSGLFASAQQQSNFSGGFYAGVIGAQIDGDAQYGYYHGGLNLAATAQYPISRNFFMSVDLAFAQKGARDKFNPGSVSLYHININYIDLPLLLHYYDRKRFGLYAGVEYSRLIGSPTQITPANFPNYTNSTYRGIAEVDNNDYEYIVGGSYYFDEHWQLDLRWCYSIVSAGESLESLYRNYGIFNNLIQVRIGYIFGMQFEKDKGKKIL